MKKIIFPLVISLLLLSCNSTEKSHQTGQYITVDVTAKHPKKDIILQEIADVEYVQLELKDNFLIAAVGARHIAGIDESGNIIICNQREGDIFVFDPNNGRAIKRANRIGRGPEEYHSVWQAAYNNETGELFIYDLSVRKISVYDIDGKFKRTMPLPQEANYEVMLPAGNDKLVFYDRWNSLKSPVTLHSVQDGSLLKKINLPFENRLHAYISDTIITIDEASSQSFMNTTTMGADNYLPVMPFGDDFIVTEASCDTIYKMDDNGVLTPLIARTPAIASMNPETFLWVDYYTDRYLFMTTRKKV